MTEANPILQDIVADPEDGALRYKGVRYLLIRPETLAGIQKAIEAGAAEGEHPMYRGGFDGGFLSSTRYRDIHGFTDPEILDFMMEMGGFIGWGKFHLDRYDRAAQVLEVSVTASPFAEAYGKAHSPVCHLIRGVVAGMGSALLGFEVRAEERACSALGDPYCRFVLVPE